MQSGKVLLPSKKITVLLKRRNRYLQQLLAIKSPLAKATGTIALTMVLSATANAQKCNIYHNAGTANPIHFQQAPPGVPFFVDIDGDGDLDYYEIAGYASMNFFKNIGTKQIPRYVLDNDESGGLSNVGGGDDMQFADIDGDGDYDFFINTSNGYNDNIKLIYYENIGTKTAPNFVRNDAGNPLAFARGSYILNFTIADFDDDGDYDLFTSDLYNRIVYENIGTATSANFQSSDFLLGGAFDRRTYVDWNKDGLTDYLDNYGNTYHRNLGPKGTSRNYVVDNTGPKFGITLRALPDLNNDGVPEAISIYGELETLTPVPVITAVKTSDKTTLIATPRNNAYRYRWQRNGRNIPGAVTPNLNVTVSGLYTVEITDSCGTGVSLPYTVKGANSVSEAEADKLLAAAQSDNLIAHPQFATYPNPFTQEFTLNLGNNFASTIIKIQDVSGRTVSITKTNDAIVKLGKNLQRGVYIIQVIQNNAFVFTKTIIKQ